MKIRIKLPKHLIRTLLAVFLTILVCLIAYYFVHNLSQYVPTYSTDDVRYTFVYQGGDITTMPKLTTVPEFFRSVIFQFMWWNARLPAIVFETLFSVAIKQSLWAVLNSLVYLLTGLVMSLLIFGKKVLVHPVFLALIFLLMGFAIPNFGMDALWHAGTTNYLWLTPIYLLFLLPYVFNSRPRFPALRFLLMILLGILAGTSNEIASTQTLIAAVLMAFFDNKDFEADWKWTGIWVLAVADFISIFRDLNGGGEATGAYGAQKFLIGDISQQALRTSGLLILVILFFGAILLWHQKQMADETLPFKLHRRLFLGIIFFIAGLAGIGALVISPLIEARLFYSDNIFFLLSLLNLLAGYLELRKKSLLPRAYPLLIVAVMAFVGLPIYEAYSASVISESNIVYTSSQILKNAHETGKKEATAMGMPTQILNPSSPFGAGYLIWYDKDAPMSIWQEKYYGVPMITGGYNGPVLSNPIPQDLPVVLLEASYDTYVKPKLLPISDFWFGRDNGGAVVYADTVTAKAVSADSTTLNPRQRSLTLEFVNSSGKVIAKEERTVWIDTTVDLSQLSLEGYTIINNPGSYAVSTDKNQTLRLSVYPDTHTFYVAYYVNGQPTFGHLETGLTGDPIAETVPYGYKALHPEQLTQTITAKTSAVTIQDGLKIDLERLPISQRLAEFWKIYLVLAGLLLIGMIELLLSRKDKAVSTDKKI